MATLSQFIGQTSGILEIYLYALSESIGTGTASGVTDFALSFSGNYTVFGSSGQISFSIALSDQDPSSTSGYCTVSVDGNTDDNATYAVDGEYLAITTSLQADVIYVYVSGDGTGIDDIIIPGHDSHDIWIGPDSSVLNGASTSLRTVKESENNPQYGEDQAERY